MGLRNPTRPLPSVARTGWYRGPVKPSLWHAWFESTAAHVTTATVYWTTVSNLDGQQPAPVSFRRLMAEASPHRATDTTLRLAGQPPEEFPTMLRCPAVTDLMTNTFQVRSPGSTGVRLTDTADGWDGESYGASKWTMKRGPALQDSLNVWMLNTAMLLFSPEPMTAQFCAPFFSQTRHMQWGVVTPGQMDISSWLRPLQFEFTLWPHVRELHLEADEPMAYVQFFSADKVVLKRFEATPEIAGIVDELMVSTYEEPRKQLDYRYDFFHRNGYAARVLEAVKASAV